MGLGGVSAWQLIILLLIVVLLFGTKRLRNVGGDLGSALKSFRQGLNDPSEGQAEETRAAGQALPKEAAEAPTEQR